MTKSEFIKSSYLQQKAIFEVLILPQFSLDKDIWQVGLVAAISTGNKEHLSEVPELVPFFQEYCKAHEMK